MWPLTHTARLSFSFALQLSLAALIACCLLAGTALAGNVAVVRTIEIGSHGFSPATVHVPAGRKFQLKVNNTGKLTAEFQSRPLQVDKVIAPDSSVTVWVGPLKAGHYRFVDSSRPTLTGEVVVQRHAERAMK